jgi:hypothetical protein
MLLDISWIDMFDPPTTIPRAVESETISDRTHLSGPTIIVDPDASTPVVSPRHVRSGGEEDVSDDPALSNASTYESIFECENPCFIFNDEESRRVFAPRLINYEEFLQRACLPMRFLAPGTVTPVLSPLFVEGCQSTHNGHQEATHSSSLPERMDQAVPFPPATAIAFSPPATRVASISPGGDVAPDEEDDIHERHTSTPAPHPPIDSVTIANETARSNFPTSDDEEDEHHADSDIDDDYDPTFYAKRQRTGRALVRKLEAQATKKRSASSTPSFGRVTPRSGIDPIVAKKPSKKTPRGNKSLPIYGPQLLTEATKDNPVKVFRRIESCDVGTYLLEGFGMSSFTLCLIRVLTSDKTSRRVIR